MNPRPRLQLRATLALAAYLALAMPAHARQSAQTTTRSIAPPPAPVVQPAPELRTAPVAPSNFATPVAPLRTPVGRWNISETDKETGVTETLLIEFRSDGSYSTQLQSSHFKSPRFHGSGRYTVANGDRSGFMLLVQRRLDDPETDKATGAETQRITWLDNDTLQAADGSVIRRVR